jgi:MFS transporter, ACDE family, multidrug resistance protein
MPVRPRAYLTLAVAAAVGTLFGAQGISAALPALGRDLGVSDAELGLFTAAYMLPAVLFAVPLGYLADSIGRRRVFVAMALLFAVAGGAQAAVSDYAALLGLRFLQGIGFGALMPMSVTLIGDAFRGTKQLRAQANRQVAMAIGEFVLPLVGAVLAAMSWQTALGAQALLLPLALAGALVLDDARPEPVSERYASELGEAVRQPGMPAVLTAGFLRFVCKFALIAYLPLMLVGDRGATLAQGALVLSVASGVAAATNLAVVRMLRRVAASRLLIASVSLVGTSLFAFAVVPDWKLALVTAVAFGIGDGILMVVQNALVTEAAPERVRAGLVSVSGMTRNAGKLVAPLAMGSLILAVSVPVSFTLVGLLTLAAVPALRPVRRLDPLLARAPSIEASTLERL